jgi:hypothetical protein
MQGKSFRASDVNVAVQPIQAGLINSIGMGGLSKLKVV